MRQLALYLSIGLGLGAQEIPSALNVNREDANQALTDTIQDLPTEAVKEAIDSRVTGLETASKLSQTKTKAQLGLGGKVNKAQLATTYKAGLAQKATWLKNWKLVAGVLEYGEAIGQAGGYLAEGDARGAMGVMVDTAGKKLSGWVGAAAGTFVAGPFGAVAGAAAGEGSWAANPLKKRLQSAEEEGRNQDYTDRLLGYRPTWRDHEAAEAKKKREAEKAKQDPAAPPTDGEEALRKQVESRLISQNLPAPEALVNQLVGLIQSRGADALEAALKECSAMQGTFEGSLNGKGGLRVTVEGLAVSGSFEHLAQASHGGVSASATTTGVFTGTFDPVSGNVAFRGVLKTIAIARGIAPTPDFTPVSFTGHFTGQGFKGTALGNGQSLPWSVVR